MACIEIQEIIDDYFKGRLETWEQVALMEFLREDPEWFDYFFISLLTYEFLKSKED